ncbi:hypothetical protein BDZ89DRAFT_1067256 [Hymenopellis radicata]|nr:hypothetical protein BDZ89DRAFT_1067256 [Hymenopellis radicata]
MAESSLGTTRAYYTFVAFKRRNEAKTKRRKRAQAAKRGDCHFWMMIIVAIIFWRRYGRFCDLIPLAVYICNKMTRFTRANVTLKIIDCVTRAALGRRSRVASRTPARTRLAPETNPYDMKRPLSPP